MSAKAIGGGLAALALLGVVLFMANRNQQVLEQGLPPRVVCESGPAAFRAAQAWQQKHGGALLPILGTGSMAPYIPAAPAGTEPKTTVVAYVVTDAGATLADVAPGKVVLYRADWLAGDLVLHGAATQDGHGWIMSGLHNERSEASWRVTEKNFVGIAAHTWVWTP